MSVTPQFWKLVTLTNQFVKGNHNPTSKSNPSHSQCYYVMTLVSNNINSTLSLSSKTTLHEMRSIPLGTSVSPKPINTLKISSFNTYFKKSTTLPSWVSPSSHEFSFLTPSQSGNFFNFLIWSSLFFFF